MTSPTPAASEPARFLGSRPDRLRSAPPWDRLSYIVAELPAALRRLSAQLEVGPGDRVLDYGCADLPYRHFFPPSAELVGADLPGNPHATLELDAAGAVPAPDESFDAVLSTQVLEHVADPGLHLAECLRVLRPGGRLLLSTHGMMVYHPDPVDYWRWTCAGLERAVRDAGFELRRLEGVMGLGATGLQLVQDAFYFRLPRPLAAALALVMQALIALADRVEPPSSRRLNALVFAVVAEKP